MTVRWEVGNRLAALKCLNSTLIVFSFYIDVCESL